MARTALTILNGFLGAGKTTLLKSLLAQANQQKLAIGVIVNDMSILDVDGVLVANSEIVSAKKQNFVTIAADSISSRSGIQKLDTALETLLASQRFDHIFLETSGSSHPLPLIKRLRDHPRVALKGVLSLVDAAMLDNDYAAGAALLPRWQARLAQGRRGMENLLAEQILFCSHLLLTKVDHLPAARVLAVARAIHPINPGVAVVATRWGNLKLDDVLAMPDYDFYRVARLVDELEQQVENETFTLASRVIEDDRPFHPQRLWDTYHQYLGAGIHRSKGFFWLPSRDDLALLWNQAAGRISLEFISYWKAGVLAHQDGRLNAEERRILQQQLANMPGRFGDRRCSLTVIGRCDQVEPFAAALRQCFLTPEEIDWWAAGGQFADPWPSKVARLKA